LILPTASDKARDSKYVPHPCYKRTIYSAGTDKKRRYRRRNGIAEVVIAELKRT